MSSLFTPIVLVLDAALVAVIVYLIRFEYKANHVAMFFWATILGIYALPAFGDAFAPVALMPGAAHPIRLAGDPVLLQAPLFALLFAIIYALVRNRLLGLAGHPDIRADMLDIGPNDVVARRFVIILACAAVVGAISGVYAVYSTTGVQGIGESGYAVFRLEADQTFVRPAVYLLAASGGGVFLAWRVRKPIALLLIVASTVAYFLLSFTRQMLMFMLVPVALYLVYTKRSLRGRLTLVAGVVAGYYFIIFLLFLRYQGSVTSALDALFRGDLFQDFLPKAAQEGGEMELRYVYYFLLDYPTSMASVIPGQTYLRLLMIAIPSEYSFGLKPSLVDLTLWSSFYSGNDFAGTEGGSLHALIFGDSFVNLGWAGALLGAGWACVAHVSSAILLRLPRVVRLAIYAPMGFAAIVVARGGVYNGCAYVFWCSLIIGAMYLLAEGTVRYGHGGTATGALGTR